MSDAASWPATIGGRVRCIRISKGLTQRALSLGTGLTESFIWLLETDRRMASVATLYKIAGALDVDASVLMSETPPPDLDLSAVS